MINKLGVVYIPELRLGRSRLVLKHFPVDRTPRYDMWHLDVDGIFVSGFLSRSRFLLRDA